MQLGEVGRLRRTTAITVDSLVDDHCGQRYPFPIAHGKRWRAGLWLYRDYWRGLVEMTQANEDIPPLPSFGRWYAAAQTTAVRCQLDRDTRSISLWRLLYDIAEHSEVMRREPRALVLRRRTTSGNEGASGEPTRTASSRALAATSSHLNLEGSERRTSLADYRSGHKQIAHTDDESGVCSADWGNRSFPMSSGSC